MKHFNSFKKLLVLIGVLTFGISQAWGYSHTSGHVYFDNTKTNWTTISMFIGKSDYSKGDYGFGKISNTQIWHYEFTDGNKFDNWQEWMLWNGSWGEEGNSIAHRKQYFGDKSYSGLNNNHEIKGGFHFISAPSNTNNGWALSVDYHENRDFMNTDQKAVAQLSSDNGSSGIANSIVGTVKVSGYQLTDNKKTSSKSQTSTIGTSSEASVSLVRTSTVTLTATPASGYEFLGWYDGNSKKSANSTWTYTCSTSTKTYYARFKEVSYYIKHPFDGSNWTWKEMTKQDDGTFTLDAKWYGGGVNIHTTESDQGATWIEANNIPGAPNNQTGITVTYIYNPTDKSLKIAAKNIYLVGEFNDWNTSDDWELKEDPATPGIYTLTKRFEARDRHQTPQGQAEYEFKLNIKGTNYTVEGNVSNKHLQYTRQSTSKVINDGTSYSDPYYNLLLQADITGDYVFTYNAATQTLTVQHPEYQPEASYLVGDFSDGVKGTDKLPKDGGQGKDWTEKHGIPINVDGNTGSVEVCGWPAGEWEFKIKINGLWYGLKDLNITQSGTYELTDAYAEMGDRNVSMITTNGECYSFTYTQNNDGTLDVLVIFGNETHAVSFNANEHGTAPATQNIHYMKTASEPTMADVDDYMFGGWYTDATCTQKYDFSTPVTEDITLYAKWIPYTQCIFFKNNLNWNNVYVYTFTADPWDEWVGVLVKDKYLEYGKMTQIGQTDVYYYVLTNKTGFRHIAFSETDMHTFEKFYKSKAVNRADRSDQMPLFIPEKDQTPTTKNENKYYSSGLWMKYNSTESGYNWRSDRNNWDANANHFTASTKGGYTFSAKVSLTGNTIYQFKTAGLDGSWFGYNGTLDQTKCKDLQFKSSESANAKIQPTVTGDYLFTIYLGDGKMMVTLDYPLGVGDYRLDYRDNRPNWHHPSHYIKKKEEGSNDTISFFIHSDKSPRVIVQRCTNVTNDGIVTWEDVNIGDVDPTASITESGVYNFVLQQVAGQADPRLLAQATPYRGNYYIRTDAAEGGWDSFRQKSNQITYSSFADAHSNFNHYYCKYIDAGRNVKFTIANNYSYCISDTLDNDDIIKKGQSSIGCLPINANVRFGWDSNTNKISRAYIKGAGMTSDRFLVLQGQDSNLKDANGNVIPKGTGTRTGLEANEEILVDQQNWIYQVEVTANKDTKVKLIAEYNGTTQYFKGNEKEYTGLLSSTTANSYKIRLVYDFKSNNLVAAMVLDGNKEVEKDDALGTDMMVIRRNQGHAEQLTFNPDSKKLTEVGTVYAVMTFTSEWINGTAKARERSLYWVSFPFDVKVSDVFGFGEYGEEWILQYYDGAERAEKGLFGDSGTYWKYIEDTKTTLNAGTGYVLALDLSKVKFLHGATEVSLYFPSTKPLTTISGKLPTAATVPAHECTIDREWTEGGTKYHHKYTDSHWNLIGVPGFADIDFDLAKTGYHFMQNDASFYYNFKLAESTYAVEASQVTEFQAMYAYMVQFAGTINWTSSEVSGVARPELVAPRNSDAEPEKVVLRLELAQGEEEEDHTFVQLQQEGATANFDLSLDLTKIMNSGFSNIYTLTDSLKIQVAGNALPMEETVVPVGVNIAAAGEYTFRMPDGTEGMVVELIDYETNTRTNLLLSDYIVTLPKGTSENRFALHIQPQKDVVTSLENIGEGLNNGEAVNKYLIDGKLIIRTAEGVFDAQGKRL